MLFFFIVSSLISVVYCQFLGSSLYNALSGYNDNDMCRYISCPFGQYCWNGNCISTGNAVPGRNAETLEYPSRSFPIMLDWRGVYKWRKAGLCANVCGHKISGYNDNDMCRYISCPFGQYCLNGNCISTGNTVPGRALGGMGGLGALTSAASLYGMGGLNRPVPGLASTYGGAPGNYGSLGLGMGMTQLGVAQSNMGGMQPCSLMQQCLNGQICVNGYCSRSNVAFSGSQVLPAQTTCAMGAICPVGQYCIAGVCVQNAMSSTFACHNGISCPMGMMCQFGRCISNGLPPGATLGAGLPGAGFGGAGLPMYGKKK